MSQRRSITRALRAHPVDEAELLQLSRLLVPHRVDPLWCCQFMPQCHQEWLHCSQQAARKNCHTMSSILLQAFEKHRESFSTFKEQVGLLSVKYHSISWITKNHTRQYATHKVQRAKTGNNSFNRESGQVFTHTHPHQRTHTHTHTYIHTHRVMHTHT